MASGWTECAPLLFREQTLLREVLNVVHSAMHSGLAQSHRALGVSPLARTTSLYAPPRGQHLVQVGSDYVLVAIATGLIVNLILSSLHRARSVQTAALASGSLAITLISNWNPYSQVTPMPVSVGCGASPQYSPTTS